MTAMASVLTYHKHYSHTDAFQSVVHRVVCGDCSTTVSLTDGNFEDKYRDRDQEDRHEVWYEKLEAIIVEELTRIT